MAGLMTPQTTQPPQAGAPAPAPNAPPADGSTPPQPGDAPGGQQQPKGPPIGMGPVDPETLKKVIANCMNVVTQTLPQIVKMVSQDQDKIDALAHSTVFVVMRVEDSLEQSGQPLNINMTLNAGAETMSDIADAMQKAGAYTYKDQEIQAAFLRAVDMYRMARQQQGRLDPKMFQQQLAQMQQQEQAGTLEKSFPGLAKFATASEKGAAPQPGQPAQPGQDDGDGPDAEDAQDQQDDQSAEGNEPAAPAPGQNFPAKMLKKKKPGSSGPISVKAHSRKARTNKPKPQKAGPNDFPAKMLKKPAPKPNPKGA